MVWFKNYDKIESGDKISCRESLKINLFKLELVQREISHTKEKLSRAADRSAFFRF